MPKTKIEDTFRHPRFESVEHAKLDQTASDIAMATINAVQAASRWIPDKKFPYKQVKLLETVIEKLQNSI